MNKFESIAEKASKAEGLLKVLANANRLTILCHLIQSPATVGELVEKIGLSQSAVSQHLAKLKELEVVEFHKSGKEVTYQVCSMEVNAIMSVIYLIYCK
ncbi:MAG: DNA-binding transcriptional ArsR family regulator [Glaciecola sp.]|jgi:DNA-binding transcriptional ArsR family regulator